MKLPTVSVVIPYFENPRGLHAVLEALDHQDGFSPRDRQGAGLQIIVADDGSASAPELPAGVRLVRQPDLGFRAAAARNLGASVAEGEVLVFLDQDTIPAPGCLAAFCERLCAEPNALVVGSRHHLVDDPQGGTIDLGQPDWLHDAWEYTDDLRGGDDTNFRFVISAVLACRREVFERLAGFDPTMVGYGGEDWELAWQAWLAGFDLRHEPLALAAHQGADWGVRSQADAATRQAAVHQKNAETLALATRITHPTMRPAAVVWEVPDIQVTWRGANDPGVSVPVLVDLLAAGDVHVLVDQVPQALAADPRIRDVVQSGGGGSGRVRPRFLVELVRPCRVPPGALTKACEEVARSGGRGRVVDSFGQVLLQIDPVRSLARGETRVTERVLDWAVVSEPVRLETEFRERGITRLQS